MYFRLLSGISPLIAVGEGIMTSACYVFQNYTRYSLCKIVSTIRKFFFFQYSFKAQYFSPLSPPVSAIGVSTLGRSALDVGVALFLRTHGLYLCIQSLAFSKKFLSSKVKQKGIFPRMLGRFGQIVRFWQGSLEESRIGWYTPKEKSFGKFLGISKIVSFLAVFCLE